MENKALTMAVLFKKQRDCGLIIEEDEDFVYLVQNDKILKKWNGYAVTIEQIRHDADQILEWQRSGIVFEKVA